MFYVQVVTARRTFRFRGPSSDAMHVWVAVFNTVAKHAVKSAKKGK